MGENDSSIYRIKPMMNYLLEDKKRLVEFLARVGITVQTNELKKTAIFYADHNGEKALIPPCNYLKEIIDNLPKNAYAKKAVEKFKNNETRKKRMQLFTDENFREEVKADITKEYSNQKESYNDFKYFEGSSYPDVYIETEKYIIVIEGKWTEASPTEKTSYIQNRNQMVRHIHDAINYAEINNLDKVVKAFYVVENDFAERNKIDRKSFQEKLPRQFGIKGYENIIAEAYLGFITWQEVEQMYPDIVNSDGWKPDCTKANHL